MFDPVRRSGKVMPSFSWVISVIIITISAYPSAPRASAGQPESSEIASNSSKVERAREHGGGRAVYWETESLRVERSETGAETLSGRLSGVTAPARLRNDDPSSEKSERTTILAAHSDSLLRLSQDLAHARNFEKAESILRALISDDPNNAAALYQLAVTLSWAGQYDESVKSYKRLHAVQPDNYGLLLEMAKVRLWNADRERDRKSYGEAVRLLQEYLKHDPSNPAGLKSLGYAHLRSGNFFDAHWVLSIALKENPGDIEAQYLLGQALAHLGEWGEAGELFERILDNRPLAHQVRLSYADLLSWMSLYDQAAAHYNTVLQSDPYNADALTGLGRMMLWQGDIGSAEIYFNSALSEHDDAEGPLFEIANLRMIEGRINDAAGFYEKVVKVNPLNRPARRRLNEVLWFTSPIASVKSGYFEDTRGYSRYWVGGDVRYPIGDHLRLDAAYSRWTFSEPETPDFHRSDLSLSLQCGFGRWLEGTLSSTASVHPHQDDSLSLRGSSSLRFSPLSGLSLYLSYGRQPYVENLAVVMNNYFFDHAGIGLDCRIGKRLSIQPSVSRSWFKGAYSLGYYDTSRRSWIPVIVRQDHGAREEAVFQISTRTTDNPSIDLRYRYSISDYQSAVGVPYWAPSDFQQHIAIVTLSEQFEGGLSLVMEGRGIYTKGTTDLGYGVSGSAGYRFGGTLYVELGAQYDRVHVDLPWEALEVRFDLGVRL